MEALLMKLTNLEKRFEDDSLKSDYQSIALEKETLPQTDSRTEIIRVTLKRKNQEGELCEERRIVKRFLSRFKATDRLDRGSYPTEALFEYDLLSAYRERHVKVPRVYHSEKDCELKMEDLGDDTLERRLALLPQNELYQEQVALLLHLALQEIQLMHTAGEKGTKIRSIVQAVSSTSPEEKVLKYYQNLVSPDDYSDEGASGFLGDFRFVLENMQGPAQPIHRNIKTSHLIFKKNGDPHPYLIDFGNAGLGIKEFDLACLLFSPDVLLDVEELREIYRDSYRAADGQQGERRFMYSGIFQSLRRCAHLREMFSSDPEVYRNYRVHSPASTNPRLYKDRASSIISLLMKESDEGSDWRRLEILQNELNRVLVARFLT